MDKFFVGRKGSGKTLDAAEECLFDWYEGNEIWGNLHLHPAFDRNYITGKRGNFHYVDAVDLIKLLVPDKDTGEVRFDSIADRETPKTLVLDEVKTQASARTFGSWINRNLVNFISQSRKRNFKVIYTDQVVSAFDKWMRQQTDTITFCRAIIDPMDIGWGTNDYPEPTWFERAEMKIDEESIYDMAFGRRALNYKYRSRENARAWLYPLYKTGEVITPVEMKYQDMGDNK